MSAFTEPLAQARVAAEILFHDVEELDEFVIAHQQDLLAALDRVERLATDMETTLTLWDRCSPPHRYECNPWRPDGKGCTCGLQEARNATHAVLSAREEGTA